MSSVISLMGRDATPGAILTKFDRSRDLDNFIIFAQFFVRSLQRILFRLARDENRLLLWTYSESIAS